MDLYYFDKDRTPHLAAAIRELCLVNGLPFTLDEQFKPDLVLNQFFLDLVVPQSPAPNTWKTYAEQISFFARFLASRGKTWLDANSDDFKAYYRIRRVGDGQMKISSRSWNIFVAASTRLYKWAQKEHYVERIPFDFKEIASGYEGHNGKTVQTSELKERDRKKDIKYMTDDDFKERFLPKVTDTRDGIRNALFVRLLMRSGLRATEAVTLRLDMLPDPDDPAYAGRKTCPMSITGKGDKQRTVRVPKSWLRDVQHYIFFDRAEAVERWKEKHPEGNPAKQGDRGFLFLTSTGTPVTYAAMYKMMRAQGKRAGFDFKAHPHMLRHSYAIYQLSAMIRELVGPKNKRGKSLSTKEAYRRMVQDPLRKLQRLMGHSDISSTFIYLDYLDDDDDIIDVTNDEEAFGPEDGYENISDEDIRSSDDEENEE